MRPPELSGCLDVCALGRFASAANQVNRQAPLAEVNPESRSEVHLEFRNSFAHNLDIAKVAILQTIQARPDSPTAYRIKVVPEPFGESFLAVSGLTYQ
jgi:hypothetical protein